MKKLGLPMLVLVAAWLMWSQAEVALLAQEGENVRPSFLVGEIQLTEYDGDSDDLLTAGLGADGLASLTPPTIADPTNPTAAELRRLTIYNNYRALVDTVPGGGYGTLYGPTVGITTTDSTTPTGKIAGKEYIAYADDGTGQQNVTLMVQIPDTFDAANPCIVTGPSSGSRGVYGAIGTSGEWGLKKGCAVAYTDKGTGMGVHDLQRGTVNLIDGTRLTATVALTQANFIATFSQTQVTTGMIAVKHAHSQQNPEKDWGLNVLQSIEFAFYLLNLPENFGPSEGGVTITPDNTIVIASSVSNGGGASMRAAEQDTQGLIDGVAVSEPNINPTLTETLVIQQGDTQWAAPNHSRTLFDYYTFLNLYQACANLAPENSIAPLNLVPRALNEGRCQGLVEAGLITGTTTITEAAIESQARINAYGILTEQNYLQPTHHFIDVIDGIVVTYAYAYGGFTVTDNLCGFSFAGLTDTFTPALLAEAALQSIFATGNGIPPTGGIEIINNNALGGPTENRVSLSTGSITQTQNLDGALCLRRLATGVDEQGNPLTGEELANHERVQAGIAEILATGNLQGKPAIIVNGRSDAILPPNHTSRAYFGLNQLVEGEASNLRYIEVKQAHHLDVLNGLAGFNSEYVPLHHYLIEALEAMYAHLSDGAPLPENQVINATARGFDDTGAVNPLTEENLPSIMETPDEVNSITFEENRVAIPEGMSVIFFYLPLLLKN